MDFPDECTSAASRREGEVVNTRPAKNVLRQDPKKSEERVREQLRKRLIEMIRRNETLRREKAR